MPTRLVDLNDCNCRVDDLNDFMVGGCLLGGNPSVTESRSSRDRATWVGGLCSQHALAILESTPLRCAE